MISPHEYGSVTFLRVSSQRHVTVPVGATAQVRDLLALHDRHDLLAQPGARVIQVEPVVKPPRCPSYGTFNG